MEEMAGSWGWGQEMRDLAGHREGVQELLRPKLGRVEAEAGAEGKEHVRGVEDRKE